MHSKQTLVKNIKLKFYPHLTEILYSWIGRANYFSPVLFRIASAVPIGISPLCTGIISVWFPFSHF